MSSRGGEAGDADAASRAAAGATPSDSAESIGETVKPRSSCPGAVDRLLEQDVESVDLIFTNPLDGRPG